MVSTKRKGSDGTDQMHHDEDPSHWKDDVDIGVEADHSSMKPKLTDKFGDKPLALQV